MCLVLDLLLCIVNLSFIMLLSCADFWAVAWLVAALGVLLSRIFVVLFCGVVLSIAVSFSGVAMLVF